MVNHHDRDHGKTWNRVCRSGNYCGSVAYTSFLARHLRHAKYAHNVWARDVCPLCILPLYHRKLGWAVGFFSNAVLFRLRRWSLARKYKQTSDIGDWYDHVVDLAFALGLFSVFAFSKYSIKIKATILVVITTFFALFVIQMGCVERQYRKREEKKKRRLVDCALSVQIQKRGCHYKCIR